MAVYPTSIIAFTTKTDKVDLVAASHINTIQSEVTAIETELGKLVKGSATDLKTRLSKSLADSGVLASGTSFPAAPADGQPFYRTDQDTFYIFDGSVWESAVVLSNVLFQRLSNVDELECQTTFEASDLTPNFTAATYGPISTVSNNDTYEKVFTTKWTKIPGISTVTVYAQAWVQINSGSNQAKIKLDIGSASGNGASTANDMAPNWVTFTVDVSSLVNGTTYDVTLSLQSYSGSDGVFASYIGSFVAMGS